MIFEHGEAKANMRARDSLKRDPFVEPSVRRRCLETDRVRRSATSLRRTVASHDNVLPGDVVEPTPGVLTTATNAMAVPNFDSFERHIFGRASSTESTRSDL